MGYVSQRSIYVSLTIQDWCSKQNVSGGTGVFFCTFFCRCIYHCPRSVCRCGRRMFLASSDTAENQTSYACRSAHDNDTLIMMHACTAVQNVLSSRAVRNPCHC